MAASERLSFDDLPETTLEVYWRAALAGMVQKRVQYRLKRLIDVTASALLLIVLSPLFLAVAVAVKVTSPGPVVYRQKRLGKDWQEFTLLKFRTMVKGADAMFDRVADMNEANGPLFKMRGDPRITPLGRILRRTFLDELPQLVNILRGEMSLVGPRPCLPSEAAQVEEGLYYRFAVPQGVTGPWQTNGYHSLTFREQFQVECEYVESWSLGKDVRILINTIPIVLLGKGA